MNEVNHEKLRELLKRALAPVGEAELKRDLWPEMLRRLQQPPMRLSWWDWALVAALAVALLLFPAVIPGLLYLL